MFVGFIAVVVILLIIVGLMSTGATSGSGGVDQTKATKAISEISALAQSTGFYKTTVDTTDYENLTVQKLVDAGIVASTDTSNITANDYNIETLADNTTDSIDNGDLVVNSKAVPGVAYKLFASEKGNSYFDISVAAKTSLTSGLLQALDSTYAKLHSDVDGDGVKDFRDNDTADGAEVITFN